MVRGFLKVNEELDTKLPERQTKASAGYDFYVIEDVEIPAYGTVMLPTNVKAYMQEDEVLMLYARSSLAIKRGLILQNTTGIIDSDFFPHEIKGALRNTTDQPVKLLKNDFIVSYCKVTNINETDTEKRYNDFKI